LFVGSWLDAFGQVGWAALLAIVLGIVVGRGARREGSGAAWNVVSLAVRLVTAGLVAGGLLALPFRVLDVQEYYSDVMYPPGATDELYEAALLSIPNAAFGAVAGLGLTLVWGFVALVLRSRLEPRPRARVRNPLASLAWIVPGLVVLLGSLELVLADDDLVTGCSSGCTPYRMSVGSRVLGAALAVIALTAAAGLASAASRAVRWGRRLVLGVSFVLALATAGVAVHQSYRTIGSAFGDYFREGWVIAGLGHQVPAGGHMSKARVNRESDFLGQVLVITEPGGAITRVRTSTGPWELEEPQAL
jgi:hypothetical protein